MNEDLFQSVWPLFLSEARDQLDALAGGLDALESAAPEQVPGTLHELRRFAHTLKGSASSLGIVDVERLMHAFEEALPAGDADRAATKADVLFDVLDAIRAALARCDGGGAPRVPGAEALLRALGEELDSVDTGATAAIAPREEPAVPAPVPAGLRELWPVFRRELADHLARLPEAVERGDGAASRELAGSVRRSAEAFGLARFAAAAKALESQLGDGRSAAESLAALREAFAQLDATAPGEASQVDRTRERVSDLGPTVQRGSSPAGDDRRAERSGETPAQEPVSPRGLVGTRNSAPFSPSPSASLRTGCVEDQPPTARSSIGLRPSTPLGLSGVAIPINPPSGVEDPPRNRSDFAEPPDLDSARAERSRRFDRSADAGRGPFLARLAEDVSALEACVAGLRSPRPEQRAATVASAAERLGGLRDAARGACAEDVAHLAETLAATLRGLEDDPPRVIAAAADAVMALDAARARLVTSPESPAPAPATSRPSAPEPRAPGEKVFRVSVRALDGLSRQVDQLLLLHGAEARRAAELSGLAIAAGEALRTCEQAARAPEPSLRAAVVALAGQLRELRRDGLRVSREAKRSVERMQLVGGLLREELVDLVMMPASVMIEPLRRVVQDVSRKLSKPVDLVLEGGDVRLDRRIIDELKDPLLHLVRNAVDHGLETPARRQALGKPRAGCVRVRVAPRGPRVTVLVEDDGAGLDLARVRAVALERGIIDAPALERLTEDEVARLIFTPGFSTAKEISTISGRGIGLDVVDDTVRRLRGSVELRSRPGQGTSFLLDLPLTLAARSGLLVSVSSEVCAVPIDGVHRVLRLRREQLGSVAGRVVAKVGERLVPYAQLADVIGLPARTHPLAEDGVQRALLLQSGGAEVALAVDAILGEQALIVQPLGPHAGKIAHLEGAAVLAKGGVVPVLDVGELVRRARPANRPAEAPRRARVLVADDSLTTRSAMKLLLELAGYQVVVASNGGEALARLRESPPCDLVVSDVEMPVLDGFGLARNIKGDAALAKTPVVLVTSLASPEDRAQGLQAGADGYVIKREVESGKLLDLVRQLIPEAPR